MDQQGSEVTNATDAAGYGVNNPFLDQSAAQPNQYYDASGQLQSGDPSQQYYGAGYSQVLIRGYKH